MAEPEGINPPPPAEGDFLFSSGVAHNYRGLRAGWRFLIYLACSIGVLKLFSLALTAAHLKLAGPLPLLVGELAFFAAFLLPATRFGRLERRPLGAYGLPGRGAFGARYWLGAVWGVAALALLLLLIKAFGDFDFGTVAMHGERLWKYGAFWAVFFIVVGFSEEFSFRGYSLFTLATGMGFWPAAALSSILFGAIHYSNSGESQVGLLSAGLIGFFFCYTLRLTGSLWFALGLHAGWDYAETFLFGVPDSGLPPNGALMQPAFHGSKWITGGTVGPEGSLLVLVVIGLLFLAYWRFGPRSKSPYLAL